MKYVKQFAWIGLFSFLGEALSLLLPLPVPGSVYGLILLVLALCFRVLKLEQIEETADFLLAVMPVLFVSPVASIMEVFGVIKDSLWAVLLVAVASTVATMLVTGWVTQLIVRRKQKKEELRHE